MNLLQKAMFVATFATVSTSAFAYGEPPTGWSLVTGASTSNVKIYKKNGAEVYAQVVDMGAGARFDLMQTKVGTMTNTNGTFNTYQRNGIVSWYNSAGATVSVVNGDFFNQNIDPTTISFAIRANGVYIEPGADPNGNARQIEFYDGVGALVTTANAWRMQTITARNALGGHAPSATPTPGSLRGRTSLCTLSPSSPSRLVLVLTHLNAYKTNVDADMVAWKCNSGSEIIMDGSASAQLVYKENGVQKVFLGSHNGTLPGVGRTVPQVIVIRNNGNQVVCCIA